MVLQIRLDTQHSSDAFSKNIFVGPSAKISQISALNPPSKSAHALVDDKQQIRQNLRNKIQCMLKIAKELPSRKCVSMIRRNLEDIQNYCAIFGKTFIVVEENIVCNQYNLQGSHHDKAILFRGPDERATVAICVTEKGSLLHRNDSDWKVYRDAGDIFIQHLVA
ncbi:MAG: hypothetical protein AAGD25_26605 [Cyanobacteria bacterium P01_F01_bin.150]